MRKRLIFVEAKAQPKKRIVSASIIFKKLKPNRTALRTKNDLEKFVYLLLNHIGSVLSRYLKKATNNISDMFYWINATFYCSKKRQDKGLTFE